MDFVYYLYFQWIFIESLPYPRVKWHIEYNGGGRGSKSCSAALLPDPSCRINSLKKYLFHSE